MMRRFLFFLISLFLLGTLNPKLSAQILEVRIAVDGMTWGGWASRVGKALKRLEGVQDAKVNLKTQSVQVILKPGAMLYPGKLKEAVETTGFTPGAIHIKAKGEIVASSDKDTKAIAELVFKIPDSGQVFLLHSPQSKERDKEQQSSERPDLLAKLIEGFDAGKKKSTVRGRVHQHKELPIGLAVEEFEFVDKKE